MSGGPGSDGRGDERSGVGEPAGVAPGSDPLAQLQQARAERDAAQRELDRLRAIPELKVGQRLRGIVGSIRRRIPAATDKDSPREIVAVPAAALSGGAAAAAPADVHAWLDVGRQWIDTPLPSVAVQVVLYGNDMASQRRLASGIGATVRHARAELGLDRVVVRYGDCSPTPCLDAADLAELTTLIGDGVDEVRHAFFDANLGSGGGSNALAAQGDEHAIWVLNPDTYPSPNALATMLVALSERSVGAVDARQIPIEHQKAYDSTSGDTSWVSGASMLVRRVAFDDADGFDAHFFPMYCDDVDLSWRLRAAGWSLRHVPRAVVHHDKPIEIGGSVRWTESAARSSHLAKLWLYRRYERPDLEQQFIATIDVDADPIGADAVREFRERTDDGDAPNTVHGGSDVATFVDGQYAPRRFGYAK